MSQRKYLSYRTGLIEGILESVPENRTSTVARKRMQPPCPISPYITPKRKGKVTMKYMPGFASL